MRALTSFHAAAFADTLAALGAAFLLGALIGFERQYRQRTAGLRTNVLVAIGAAAFVDLGADVMPVGGAAEIIAYVVAGIGFLGAGVIMQEGTRVRGLNTAATLWCSAAVGACAGAGAIAQAVALTAFVLAGNTLLRPLVNYINRQPLDEGSTEALYQVHVVCGSSDVSDMRELIYAELEKANYPIQSMEILSETEEHVELTASLVPTTPDPEEMDAVVRALEAAPGVESAAWTVSTTS
jgi:putative Mg2+ transporter-C (MgtC) family protein